jgi:hypothetical protein
MRCPRCVASSSLPNNKNCPEKIGQRADCNVKNTGFCCQQVTSK